MEVGDRFNNIFNGIIFKLSILLFVANFSTRLYVKSPSLHLHVLW